MANQRLKFLATFAVLLSAVAFSFAEVPHDDENLTPALEEITEPVASMKCYTNEPDCWWEANCDSKKICVEASPQPGSEAECKQLSYGTPHKPHPQWAASQYDCRVAVQKEGGCSNFPAHPEPEDPEAPVEPHSTKACFVSKAYHKQDCLDPELCELKVEYPTEEACSKSGFPHSDWVKDVDACRSERKSEGSCHDI